MFFCLFSLMVLWSTGDAKIVIDDRIHSMVKFVAELLRNEREKATTDITDTGKSVDTIWQMMRDTIDSVSMIKLSDVKISMRKALIDIYKLRKVKKVSKFFKKLKSAKDEDGDVTQDGSSQGHNVYFFPSDQ